MDIRQTLKNRRIELGLTLKDIANKVGVNEGTVSRWESGDIENMRRDKIMALATALEISPAIIMGWQDNTQQMSTRHAITIKVLGRVSAGIPIEAVENVIDTEEITEEMAKTGTFFGLQIRGDSMEPRIYDGDVVIVRQQDDAESGDIVIALVNGDDAVCKRLSKYAGGISLISLNSKYDPLIFTDKDIQNKPVRIIGKVVELRGKF